MQHNQANFVGTLPFGIPYIFVILTANLSLLKNLSATLTEVLFCIFSNWAAQQCFVIRVHWRSKPRSYIFPHNLEDHKQNYADVD